MTLPAAKTLASMTPPVGSTGIDIRNIISNILNFAKSSTSNQVSTAPCDGFVLKMHYRWTFFIFLGGFLSVWYSWYHREVITCVSHFNAESQVRLDYINICLSYPFISQDDGTRRYLLFYRWIHWTFLLLAGVYYIPRKLSKVWENPKFKNLLEKLAVNSYRIDEVERDCVEITARYVAFNFHTHNGLYYKYIITNMVALIVDLLTLGFLDFILQNRFIGYGYYAFPYSRDPKTFSDYMSMTFPPFASCELEESNQLTARRDEALGCHLTFMELYEKIFLFLWLWIFILILVSTIYIIFLFFMCIPWFHSFLLKTAKPVVVGSRISVTIEAVCMKCKVGDVYLLYRLKQYFSHARFYELLRILSAPSVYQAQYIINAARPEKTATRGGEGARRRKNSPTAPSKDSTDGTTDDETLRLTKDSDDTKITIE